MIANYYNITFFYYGREPTVAHIWQAINHRMDMTYKEIALTFVPYMIRWQNTEPSPLQIWEWIEHKNI